MEDIGLTALKDFVTVTVIPLHVTFFLSCLSGNYYILSAIY